MIHVKKVTGFVAVLSFVLLKPATGQEPCVCGCTFEGETNWHTCIETPYIDWTGPIHDIFVWGSCESHGHHQVCDPQLTNDSLETFATAVLDAESADRIHSILEAMNGQAYFNVQRKAIQIRGCGGRIIANIPLRGNVANALAEG